MVRKRNKKRYSGLGLVLLISTSMLPNSKPNDLIDYQLLRLGSNVSCASQTLLSLWNPKERTNGNASHFSAALSSLSALA